MAISCGLTSYLLNAYFVIGIVLSNLQSTDSATKESLQTTLLALWLSTLQNYEK